MDNFEGKQIIDNLEYFKSIQEAEDKKVPERFKGAKCKSVEWAQHYVRHFFGMETDCFTVDLLLEIKHLKFFAEHLGEHENGTDNFEVKLRILDYIKSLEDYLKLLERGDLHDKS